MEEEIKKKKHPILKVILRILLIILIIVVLFVGGFIGYSTFKNGWGLQGMLKTMVGSTVKNPEELGDLRVLILGVSEDISTPLTDTIMVASYNPATQKATLLSIPRDTFVGTSKLRADSYDKINAIYQKEGPEGTLKRVNKLTGLDLKYYVVISNNALVELVDEIGGVEFNVPIDMYYTSKRQNLYINLKKGKQKLNGEQAEGLVRFRKSNSNTTYPAEYGNDDFGRMRTQREFIKAVAKQTLQAKNITKIGDLIDIVKRNVKTNIKDWNEVKEYIPYAVEFNTDNLQSENIPGDSTRIPAGTGLWFFLADETKTEKLVKELYKNEKTKDEEAEGSSQDNNSSASTGSNTSENTVSSSSNTSTNTSSSSNSNTSSSSSSSNTNSNTTSNANSNKSNSKIKVEILNGSGDSKLLTKAKEALKQEGYNVYKTGKTSTTQVTTIINKAKLSESEISDLKSTLGTGVISSSSATSKVDVTIILGKDYNK